MNSSRIKKSGRKKNRSFIEESEHESPTYIVSNISIISQIDSLPESLKIILNNSVERDIIHSREAKVYYDGWTALYFNKYVYVWKYNEGEVYIYNDLPTDEEPLSSSLIQIFPGSDSSHPSLLVVYPSGNCYYKESLKINSLHGKISLHKHSKCVNLQRIKDSHFLLLSSDMILYHITTNAMKGFSWIELNFTYSYLPVITNIIPLFPYYPSYINCYNNHNLYIDNENQIIIINNQYITRLLINDDKEMNNLTCTGQYDVLKKGIPTITSIENNNENERTPNEITIVDTVLDKNLLYILIGCQQYDIIQKQETLAYFLMAFDIAKNKEITLIETVCISDKYKWDNNINNRLINSEIITDSFDQLYAMVYDIEDSNNNREVVNVYICNKKNLTKNENSFNMIKLDYYKDIYGYSTLTKNSNTIMLILTKSYGYITIRLPVHIRSEIGIGDMSSMSSYNKLDNCFQSYLKNGIDIMTNEDKKDEKVEWSDIVMKFSDNLVDSEPILPSLQYKNILNENNQQQQQSQNQQQQQQQEFYTNQQAIGEGIKKKLENYQAYLNYLKLSGLYPSDAEIKLKLLSNYEIILLSHKFHENYSKYYTQQQDYGRVIEILQMMMKMIVSENNNNNNNSKSNNNIESQFYTSLSHFPKMVCYLLNLSSEDYYLETTSAPSSSSTTTTTTTTTTNTSNKFTYFPITVITKILVDMFKSLIDIRKNVCNVEYDIIFKESPHDQNSKLIWTNSDDMKNAFNQYLYSLENEMSLQNNAKDLTDLYREIGNIMLFIYEDKSDKLKQQLFKWLIKYGGYDNSKTIKFAESIKYFKALIEMIEYNYKEHKINKEKYKNIIKNYFVIFKDQNFASHFVNYYKSQPYKYLTFVDDIPEEIERFLIDNNENDILPLFYQLRKQYEKSSNEYQLLSNRINDNIDLKERYLCLSTLNHYITLKSNNNKVMQMEENKEGDDKLGVLKNDIRITQCQKDFEEILNLEDDSVFSIDDYIERIKRYIQNNRNEINNIRKLFKIVVVVICSCNEDEERKKEYFNDLLIFVIKQQQNSYDKLIKSIKKKYPQENFDKDLIGDYIEDNMNNVKELLLFQVINELKNNLDRSMYSESFDGSLSEDMKLLCIGITDKAILA